MLDLFDSLQLPMAVLANASIYRYCPTVMDAFRARKAEVNERGTPCSPPDRTTAACMLPFYTWHVSLTGVLRQLRALTHPLLLLLVASGGCPRAHEFRGAGDPLRARGDGSHRSNDRRD
jgi:hypothetical protein